MVKKSFRNKSSVIAVVPMRHSSERVPGKNFRSFAGKPLYHHIINCLYKTPLVSSIVIDTDSPFIRKDAQSHFPEVILLDRPEKLRSGTTPMNEVLLHDMDCIEGDFFLQTHSTNPLLKPESVNRAIDVFFTQYPQNDSLFSVTKIQARLWDRKGHAINHNPDVLVRTQDLTPVYLENSCIYIFSKQGLLETRNRIGRRPFLFQLDQIESWDIDEEHDFIIAEKISETTSYQG